MKKKVLFLSAVLLVLSIVTCTALSESAYTPVTPNVQTTATHTLTLTGDGTGITEGIEITYTFSVGNLEIVQPTSYNTGQTDLLITGSPTITNSVVYDHQSTFTDKSCTQTLDIDWSGVTVKEPGIYRWPVTTTVNTENPTGTDVATNGMNQNYLFLYAYDDNGTLKAENMGFTNLQNLFPTDSEEIANKTKLYEEFPASVVDLEISKTVAGDQGSRDQYFQFTIQLTAPVALNKSFDVTGTFDESISPTPYDNNNHSNKTTVTFENSNKTTATFWLKHGQSIKINDLPFGTSYTISETDNGYTVTAEIEGDTTATNNCPDKPEVTDTSLQKDTEVAFTNTKTSKIPTGIELETVSALMGILAAVSLLGLLFIGRRREENRL